MTNKDIEIIDTETQMGNRTLGVVYQTGDTLVFTTVDGGLGAIHLESFMSTMYDEYDDELHYQLRFMDGDRLYKDFTGESHCGGYNYLQQAQNYLETIGYFDRKEYEMNVAAFEEQVKLEHERQKINNKKKDLLEAYNLLKEYIKESPLYKMTDEEFEEWMNEAFKVEID